MKRKFYIFKKTDYCLMMRWHLDLLFLLFRVQLVLRETEERLVKLEREATRDTEDSLVHLVCPDLL